MANNVICLMFVLNGASREFQKVRGQKLVDIPVLRALCFSGLLLIFRQ